MTDTPIKSPSIRRRRGIFTVGQEQHHRRGEGTNLQRRLPASNALSSKAVWSIGNVSPAIATSDVPPCGCSRSMAVRISPCSLVGCYTIRPPLPKATTPILIVAGCCSTKARAAALAASIRVGSRSSAAMLLETSKARITVPSTRGSETFAWGRASPKSRKINATRKRRKGR